MVEFHISVDIDASPRQVWAVMSDIERWAEWTPTVKSIRRVDSGPLQTGSRAWVRQPRLPPAYWRITELIEGRSFTWVTRSPGVVVKAHHGVEPRAQGARATLSIQFSGLLGPLVARLTRSLNESYLAIEAKGLKQRSEASVS